MVTMSNATHGKFLRGLRKNARPVKRRGCRFCVVTIIGDKVTHMDGCPNGNAPVPGFKTGRASTRG